MGKDAFVRLHYGDEDRIIVNNSKKKRKEMKRQDRIGQEIKFKKTDEKKTKKGILPIGEGRPKVVLTLCTGSVWGWGNSEGF